MLDVPKPLKHYSRQHFLLTITAVKQPIVHSTSATGRTPNTSKSWPWQTNHTSFPAVLAHQPYALMLNWNEETYLGFLSTIVGHCGSLLPINFKTHAGPFLWRVNSINTLKTFRYHKYSRIEPKKNTSCLVNFGRSCWRKERP